MCLKSAGLLGLNQFTDDLLRCDHPCQTNTRRKDFGEGAQIDDITGVTIHVAAVFAVERDDRRDMVAFEAQLAVGIILHNRDPVPVGQFRPTACGVPG